MSSRKAKQKEQKSDKITPAEVKFVEDAIFSTKNLVNMAIYAILETRHESYFGSHSEKNVNILETVTLRMEIKEGDVWKSVEIKKSFYSPSKQRGVERRAIAYSLVKTSDGLVPYYKFFNLSIDVTNTYPNGIPDPRDILTFVWGATWTEPTLYLRGRIGYGGGVAIQPDSIVVKHRNRLEYRHFEATEKRGKEGGEEGEGSAETAQTIWMKEYVEPHVLIPVYRSGILLGVENYEPHAVAYAFLRGLELAGAGTPKGMSIVEAYWLEDDVKEKVLVVDVGASLLPEPVVISPAILSIAEALGEFKRKATLEQSKILKSWEDPSDVFKKVVSNYTSYRLIGDSAYRFLRALAERFEKEYLGKIEDLQIPRVKTMKQKS